MKLGRFRLTGFVALLAVTLTSIPAHAWPKGGNGGGGNGGGDEPPPPNFPPVAYDVDYQPVEGLIRILSALDDGRVLADVAVSELSTSIPTTGLSTLAIVYPDGSVTYPELTPVFQDWDLSYENTCYMNNSGQIVGVGDKNGQISLFFYTPPVGGSPASVIQGDPVPGDDWIDVARGLTDNGLVLVNSFSTDIDSSWVWSPQSDQWLPIGVDHTSTDELVFRDDVSFSLLTSDGRLYGGFVEPGTPYTAGYFQSDVLTDSPTAFVRVDEASDSGFSINRSTHSVKIKGHLRFYETISVYDAAGNVVYSYSLQLGDTSNWSYLSEETIDGLPVFAASVYNNGPNRFWVKIPGFDEFSVLDLMDSVELQQFQALDIGGDYTSGHNGSTFYPKLTTPLESVSGAPSFVGEAYHYGYYMGIYRVTPHLVE